MAGLFQAWSLDPQKDTVPERKPGNEEQQATAIRRHLAAASRKPTHSPSKKEVAEDKALARIDTAVREADPEFYKTIFMEVFDELKSEAVRREMLKRGAGATYILEQGRLIHVKNR